jgi:hypothetical protein
MSAALNAVSVLQHGCVCQERTDSLGRSMALVQW